MTTPLSFGHRYEYPPGIHPGLVDQTYYSEFPEKAGFVNDQIAEERVIKAYLSYYGFGHGLIQTFLSHAHKTPVRYVITDCSSSMSSRQTRVLEKKNSHFKNVPKTQWDEVVATLRFQVGLSHNANAATEFRLGTGTDPAQEPMLIGGLGSPDRTTEMFAKYQKGPQRSDLAKEIKEIVAEIILNAAQVRSLGKKIVIIIFTDVIPTDLDLLDYLAPVNSLPVSMVVRLCTSDAEVVAYWMKLKGNLLQVKVDVIMDWIREAHLKKETRKNSWLSYGLPIQRLREFGVIGCETDKDETCTLSPQELRAFLAYLFGTKSSCIPDPEARYKDFMFAVDLLNDREDLVWDPISSRMKMRVNMARLREAYPPSIQLPADGVRLRDPVDCCACAPSKCCNDPAEWKTRRNTKPRAEVADCCCHPVKSDKRAQLAAEQAKKDHLCFPKGADAECCPKKNENDECCVDGTCLPSGTDAKQKEKPGGCCAKFDESGNKVEEDCCVNNQEECCPTGGKKKEAGAAGGGCCAKGGVSTNGNGAVKSPAKSSALKVKAVKAGPVIEKKPPVKCCAVVEKEDPECCPNDIRAEGDDCCYRAPCLPKPVKAVKKGTVKAPVVVGDGGRSGNSPSGGEASVTVAPKSEEVVKAPKKSNGFFGKKAKAGAEVPGGVAVDGAAPPAAGVPAPAVTSDGADVKAAAPKKAVVSGKGWFGKKEKSEKAPVVVA